MKVVGLPKGKFLGACLENSHMPLKIVELEFPKSLAEKQVLVKNLFSSICGSQIGEIDAKKGPDRFLPHLLGHEAVSQVVAIGSAVSEVKVGETVILHWMKGKGGEAVEHFLYSGARRINAGPVTTFSEYSLISENRCTKINTTLEPHLLPLLGCSFTTAHGALKNDIEIQPEDYLLVLGLGPLGMCTLEMSKLFGVTNILGVDFQKEKIARAQEMNFNTCQWNFTGPVPKTLENFHSSRSGSRLIIVETTGTINVIERAFEFLGNHGKMVLVGVTPHGKKISIDPMPLHFGAEIVGSYGGQTLPQNDIPRLIRLAEMNSFRLDILECDIFELGQINKAIDQIRQGSSRKKVIGFTRLSENTP